MAKTYKKRSIRKVKNVAHRRAHTKRSSKRTTKKMVDHVHPLAKSEKINMTNKSNVILSNLDKKKKGTLTDINYRTFSQGLTYNIR
jgi:hypothetical protein